MYVSLYIIPGDCVPDVDRAVCSFGKSLIQNVVVCDSRIPPFTEALAPYKAYMYSDEYCSDALRLALPIFFQYTYWDYLVLFRKNIKDNKFFQAPRIFKSEITMDGLLPKYQKFYQHEKILNGFLLRE